MYIYIFKSDLFKESRTIVSNFPLDIIALLALVNTGFSKQTWYVAERY